MRRFRKLLIMVYAGSAYLAGTAGLLALPVFLLGLHSDWSVRGPSHLPIRQAFLVDTVLMLIWTAQHVGMTRPRFKAALCRVLPEYLERSTCVLWTGLGVWLVLAAWSPMNDIVFELTGAVPIALFRGVFLTGWAYALAGILYDSYFEFYGLKQPFLHVRGKPFAPAPFSTGFVFRLSRRPTFFGILVGCWATPVMTLGHLHFAIGMTLFTLFGSFFVERTCVERHGDADRLVQRQKPLILPNPRLAFRSPRAALETSSRMEH